ncbi:putative D-aminoacylase [Minicystis rosea]|nr:putative D-aminoacylase [Minicystis rosea]
MDLDLVIQGGTLIDGTGRPRFAGDLGIRDGRIAVVAVPGALTGQRTLDAKGLAVAPGFVDIHSHSDWVLPLPDHDEILAPLAQQGVTTIVAGNCGFSPAPVTDASVPITEHTTELLREGDFSYRWRSMGELLDQLDRNGVFLNTAMLVGHGTLRQAVMGRSANAPDRRELEALCALTRQSLREGAFGISAGLAYAPGVFAKNDELLALLRAASEEGGLFTVHGRAYTWVSPFYKPMVLGAPHNLRSVRELIDLARDARIRLQLSHQIFIGRRTWRTYPAVLRAIDEAAASGVDVAFDAFPYTVGNTTVNAIFPDWVLDHFQKRINDPAIIARLRREHLLFRLGLGLEYSDITLLWGAIPELLPYEGLDFESIARKMGVDAFEAYVHVARMSDGKARVLIGTYSGDGDSEEPLRAVLSHPLCAFETDTILTRRGKHNPASFGTFPRVLGRYSRELGLFSLEEGIRRMTSLPAERIGLSGVGRIAPGARADLVLFDPARIGDNTGPGRSDAAPSGVARVMIGGETVVEAGALVKGPRRGKVLRR